MINNTKNIFISFFKKTFLFCKYKKRIRIGRRFKAYKSDICITNKSGRIYIGSSLKILKNSIIQSDGGVINIGDNVFINSGCFIVSRVKISIGNNVSIGPNVCVYDHNHSDNRLNKEKQEIIIEDGAWIGANSVILSGVRIGKNAIIGAGTVVTKNVESGSVYFKK